MTDGNSRPAGIREIAASLGVSIGTVDRALHGRTGVSPKTRERVLKMAETLNYSPNVAARSLRLNRQLRIGVFLPEHILSFFDVVRAGLRDAASSWSGAVIDLVFHSYPRLGQGERRAFEAANWTQFDGLILAPGSSASLAVLRRDAAQPIPMVFVATDSPRLERLASVSADALVSGSIAAELLGRVLPKPAKVATFTGDLQIQDHADKLVGFAESLARYAPHLSLLPPVESHERAAEAYESALVLFKNQPSLGGIYVNTANSLPVLRAAQETGLLGRVQIVTTDLFPELVPMIESGSVLATLYQRPYTQGRMAFEMLSHFLTSGTRPGRHTRLAPHIILRSNLKLFLQQTTVEEAHTPEADSALKQRGS